MLKNWIYLLVISGLVSLSGCDWVMSAPQADAGPGQDVLIESTVTLDGSGSSSTTATLIYRWSFSSRPTDSNAVLSDSTRVNPSFTADIEGEYILNLVVNDGRLDSASDQVTITASTTNSTLVAHAGPYQNVSTSSTVTLNGSESSGADALNYLWSFVSIPTDSSAVLSDVNNVSPTFNADLDGSYVIQLIVSDESSESLPVTVIITSSGANSVHSIAGCQIFPDDNFWNKSIIDYPLHPKSADYINNIGGANLHPDFGDGVRENGELQVAYGIPFVVVSADPDKYQNNSNIYKKSGIPASFLWWDESDCQTTGTASEKLCTSSTPPAYPSPAERIAQVSTDVAEISKIIESGSDSHLVSIDADTCQLYEVQSYNYTVSGNSITDVTGASGAIWDLSKNEQRDNNMTSADAAGLAILPGLVKFDEIFKKYDPINGHEYGSINHAIRITLRNPQNAYINPATHSDGNQGGGCGFSEDSNCLPMGQKLRLKTTLAQINDSDNTEAVKIVLRALRNYGVVIADTGGNMMISGEHDPRWINDDVDINALKDITASDFEAVIEPEGAMVYEYSGQGRSVFFEPEAPIEPPEMGDDEFEFIVFGDFNQGGCARNERVVELINLMAANENDTAAFYVSTGDLIDGYLNNGGGDLSFGADIDNSACGAGASDGNIKEILAPIKERTPFAGLNASFYPAIGNHDGGWGSGWYPDPWGQGICDMLTPNTPMDFINHEVPDLSGGVLAPTPENASAINSLFCNKQESSSSLHPYNFFYSFGYKNSHFIMLSLFDDYQSLRESQMSFLESELTAAKNAGKHIFVFAHAPLYTTNFDRHRPTTNWRAYTDLFDTYGVDVYFNGHNHSYERSYALKGDPNDESGRIRDDSGTVYLTVGSAGGGSDGTPDITNPLTEVTARSPDWAQVKNWSKNAWAREITVYLKVKVKGAQVSFEATTIGIDDVAIINSGGNLVPLDEIIIGPRQVDSGSLRKYP